MKRTIMLYFKLCLFYVFATVLVLLGTYIDVRYMDFGHHSEFFVKCTQAIYFVGIVHIIVYGTLLLFGNQNGSSFSVEGKKLQIVREYRQKHEDQFSMFLNDMRGASNKSKESNPNNPK